MILDEILGKILGKILGAILRSRKSPMSNILSYELKLNNLSYN